MVHTVEKNNNIEKTNKSTGAIRNDDVNFTNSIFIGLKSMPP